jgi:hypothetical protein
MTNLASERLGHLGLGLHTSFYDMRMGMIT